MRVLLLSALVWACQIDQAEVSSVAGMAYGDEEGQKWTRSTSDSPVDSFNPEFIPYMGEQSAPYNECVAVDIEQTGAEIYERWLSEKIDELIQGQTEFLKFPPSLNRDEEQAQRDEAGQWLFGAIDPVVADMARDYRRPSIIDNGEAKVLCVSVYDTRGRRSSVNMFSFWDGQKAMRVGCSKVQSDFVCRDVDDRVVYQSNAFGGGDLASSVANMILGARFDKVSNGRVKIVAQSLREEHVAFFPHQAKEYPEFATDRNRTRNFNGIASVKTTGDDVITPCEQGFYPEVRCKELGVKSHACSYRDATSENLMCKREEGGILIKYEHKDILRVVNCEYNTGAQHFYCSDRNTVYFERYGVWVVFRSDTQHTQQRDTTPPPPAASDVTVGPLSKPAEEEDDDDDAGYLEEVEGGIQ